MAAKTTANPDDCSGGLHRKACQRLRERRLRCEP